jgi:2-oxoglutarate ferredoxin oxidoreductase subunit delta
MPNIEINSKWCKSCYICVDVCPRKVLEIDQATFQKGRHPVLVAHLEDCTVCRQCELLCPDLAIVVSDDSKGEVE